MRICEQLRLFTLHFVCDHFYTTTAKPSSYGTEGPQNLHIYCLSSVENVCRPALHDSFNSLAIQFLTFISIPHTCSCLHIGPWLHLEWIHLCNYKLPHPIVQYPFSFLPPSSCCALTSLRLPARSLASAVCKSISINPTLISQPSLGPMIKQLWKHHCQISDPLFSSVPTSEPQPGPQYLHWCLSEGDCVACSISKHNTPPSYFFRAVLKTVPSSQGWLPLLMHLLSPPISERKQNLSAL